ncbi:unnamed protein product [Soboliphyme baturini]|uniref:ZP domain-containing protein n=1 Tax=Soboliphyme baturini TaxID=241478 RepID=A0A183IT02_9BILA|nr:unnamed protein product [Soboliphyme baturini]
MQLTVAQHSISQVLLRIINSMNVDVPTVHCGNNEIEVVFRTVKQFSGKIYVKGEYGNKTCSKSYETVTLKEPSHSWPASQKSLLDSSLSARPDSCPPCPPCQTDSPLQQTIQQENGYFANIIVKTGTCNMKRERSVRKFQAKLYNKTEYACFQLNPAGVVISFTAVVSFHRYFITKVDRAYRIRCFYVETDKTVTSMLSVNSSVPTKIQENVAAPKCFYSIRRNFPQGPLAKFVRVGEQVYQHWKCEASASDIFGILVHSCLVNDGHEQQVVVIDDKGCSLDRFLVGEISYTDELEAFVETTIFKFADRSALEFQCSISVCLRMNNGCDGITPPQCEKRSKTRRSPKQSNTITASANDWLISAQTIQVVDLDDKFSLDFLSSNDQPEKTESRLNKLKFEKGKGSKGYCFTVIGFGIVVSFSTFICTIIVILAAIIYATRKDMIIFDMN